MTWRAAKVVAVHDETTTARTLALAVRYWPGHVAGQHVDVRLSAPDGYLRSDPTPLPLRLVPMDALKSQSSDCRTAKSHRTSHKKSWSAMS